MELIRDIGKQHTTTKGTFQEKKIHCMLRDEKYNVYAEAEIINRDGGSDNWEVWEVKTEFNANSLSQFQKIRVKRSLPHTLRECKNIINKVFDNAEKHYSTKQ
jgi:hypothetical protein